jgi:hypothetical protein
MLRHSRRHHRVQHARWKQRRLQFLRWFAPWHADRPQDWDTHTPVLHATKNWEARHEEERAYRQRVRKALAHDEEIPALKHDWAD